MSWDPDSALAFGCSRRGASHVAANTPCQDAWKICRHRTPDVNVLILAAADGHGASMHDLSEYGSKLAVEAMVEELVVFSESFDGARASQDVQDCFRADLPKKIVDRWRAKVEADAVLRFGAKHLDQEHGFDLYFRYGSTVLGAMVTAEELFMISIGDGDIVKLTVDGNVRLHIEQDAPELKGSMTFSLASNDPEMLFETRILDFNPGGLVSLSTDGLAKSFQQAGYFWEFVVATQERLHADGFDKTVSALPEILDYISQHGSGDDMTFVFAWFKETAPSEDTLAATHHSIELRDNERLEMEGKAVIE
jgi:serine/threonine protein phosphatase PrpC